MGSSINLAEIPRRELTGPPSPDRGSCELLRAVARRSDPCPAEQIDRLAAGVGNWNALLHTAREHRMSAMLFSFFQEAGRPIPARAEQSLKAEYNRNAFHAIANAAELIGLLETFDQAAIPALPMKGVVLAASAYGNLTTRPAGDLDLLIEWKHLRHATQLMLERGYELVTPLCTDGIPVARDNHQYEFERKSDGLLVELHWQLDLVFGKFRRDLGLGWAWPGRRTTLLAGAEVPDMSPEFTLLMLCLHGSKHIWMRLIWICDVAQWIQANPALDWEQAIREARRSGLTRALALGVLLAHRVAGARVPDAVLQRFESDRAASGLAEQIDRNLFDAPGKPPEGRIPYGIRLLSPRDRLRMVFSLDFWRPNEMDLKSIRLPLPLRWLYWILRPARILWNVAARRRTSPREE